MRRVLAIRLGALGDMVLSFPAFADLRAHHAGDHLTLLTTAPYEALARASPWFDAVRVDARPAWTDLPGLWRLRRQLRGFDLVYDLQTSRRSSRYFRLAGRPAWSGIAPGCALPDPDPRRDSLHTAARQRGQLAAAGVPPSPLDLAWLCRGGPRVPPPYALLVPGTSPSQGGAKKWPVAHMAELAASLGAAGLRPVVVGVGAEGADAAAIAQRCARALDLTGKTSILDLAGLAGRAAMAVGGDTGPIHLAGAMGCRTLALFSRFSDPALARPVGPCRLIQADVLASVGADAAMARLRGGPGEADWLAADGSGPGQPRPDCR